MASRINADLYYDKTEIEAVIGKLNEVSYAIAGEYKESVLEAISILEDVAGEIEDDFDEYNEDSEEDDYGERSEP